MIKRNIGLALFLILALSSLCSYDIEITNPEKAVLISRLHRTADTFKELQFLENIRVSRYGFRSLLPTLSMAFSETDRIDRFAEDVRSKSLQISINQLIFDRGERWDSFTLNKRVALIEYQSFLQERELLDIEVFKSYYAVLQSSRQLEIQDQLYSLTMHQGAVVAREFQLGMITEPDFLDFQITKAHIEAEKFKYERLYRTSVDSFKRIIGLPNDSSVLITGDFVQDHLHSITTEKKKQLSAMALSGNLSLTRKILELYVAEQALSLKKSTLLPDVFLAANFSISGERPPFQNPSYSVQLSFSFKNSLFPVNIGTGFDFSDYGLKGVNNQTSSTILESLGYFSENRLKRINALLKGEEKKDTVLGLSTTIETTIDNYNDMIREYEILRMRNELLQKRLLISKTQFEMGEKKRVDYLNDMIGFSKSELEEMQRRFELKLATMQIEAVAGMRFGGLNDFLSN